MYVYVKRAHMRAIPGLEDFMKEWVKSWGKRGALARIGMVTMPDDTAALNAAKVRNMTLLTAEELAAKK
jgi:phosphate transport system substrate-binding protein